MKVENSLHVVDARDLYLKWNDHQLERLADSLSDDVFFVIKLIPLLLHVNSRFLPGHIGLDAPSGVYSYSPSQSILKDASSINKKFKYQDEGKIKNSAIDSLFFQKNIIDGKLRLWIFKDINLSKDQSGLMKEKIDKISSWVSFRGVKLDIVILTSVEFSESPKYVSNGNKSIYMDYFYSEIVLLAGKYPVWWLVPPDKNNEYSAFVEHIKQARFVDDGEYIDLGSTNDFHKSDILNYAVNQIKTVKKSAEICLVKLMIASQRCAAWAEMDGVSIRLKYKLYQSEANINSLSIVSDMMYEVISRHADIKQVHNPHKIFSRLKTVSTELNTDVLDAFLGDDYYREGYVSEIDNIVSYLNLFKSIAYEIKSIFTEIVDACSLGDNATESDKKLDDVVTNMLVFLADNPGRVPVYNNKESDGIVLDRIQLKHQINDAKDKWSLVLFESEGNEKIIEGFNNLLALLSWCWLNRLVNHLTQISISCPKQQVRQTEARYMLDILILNISPKLISDVPAEAFDNPARPMQCILFINFMLDKRQNSLASDLHVYCEQLAINSWGDAHTKQYVGNMGILKCLCDWTHYSPIDSLSRPQNLEAFGHNTGESTHMAQRVNKIYSEMTSFFYFDRSINGRFLLRLESNFYVIYVEDGLLKPDKVGGKRDLVEYLEEPLACYLPSMLESKAVVEEPLREIYQTNKENLLQVFFKLSNRRTYCWVIDERGSLWRDVIDDVDRESFVTHWLYLFRNIGNRLKKISYEDKELPGLEIKQISTNQLGGLEFYQIGSDGLTGAKKFIDVRVTIEAHDEGDQLSMICDGRSFSYKDFKRKALTECVEYISSKISIAGRMPVYVTDIDIPLRLFNITQSDEIQISHILKFKRTFERRIYKLLGAG